MNKVIFEIPSRIHITLIGMNDGFFRINGGVGFRIGNPQLIVKVSKSNNIDITDNRKFPFSKDEIKRLKKLLKLVKNSYNLKYAISINFEGDVPTHFGLGSTTNARIASLEGLFIINDLKIDKNLLLSLSKRGGTSGVGINTYFSGGLIFDIGRKSDDLRFKPSSHSENRKNLPLVLNKIKMPEWRVGICIPKNITPKTEYEEKLFFRKICPISDKEVFKTLYYVVYGLLGSLYDNDRNTFNQAIKIIQNCKWKKSERNLYKNYINSTENLLYKLKCDSVGMSSLGPSLFFFNENIDKLSKNKEILKDNNIITTKPDNIGRKIKYD